MALELQESVRQALPLKSGEEVRLFVASDLLGSGVYGDSFLVATTDRLWQIEPAAGMTQMNGQPRISGTWILSELSNFRFDELVDAGSLIANHNGASIELLRGSAVNSAHFVNAAKRLSQLAKGEDLDDEAEAKRVCPKCHRPLPKDSNVCEFCVNH